ncbi:MAG: hypothetical protein KAX15_04080 [Candidatus Omnitrophica bacterium]|nr:hypothetical protein [Candidatus Omnitrophota bacterium]
MTERIKKQNKLVKPVKTIEELEEFFLHEKEETLNKFLLGLIERPLLENVLRKTKENQTKAAKILGISRSNLNAKIRKFKIKREGKIR